MGFVPESKARALADSRVVAVLSDIFRALVKGGGARKVAGELRAPSSAPAGRVDALARDIADVQREYGNILQARAGGRRFWRWGAAPCPLLGCPPRGNGVAAPPSCPATSARAERHLLF